MLVLAVHTHCASSKPYLTGAADDTPWRCESRRSAVGSHIRLPVVRITMAVMRMMEHHNSRALLGVVRCTNIIRVSYVREFSGNTYY